jgi:hypothetical protein
LRRGDSSDSTIENKTKKELSTRLLEESPEVLNMGPCKNISQIQVPVIYFFPTPPIKLKLGLQIGGRLLMAIRLDQSNYLANQKQGAINKYNLIMFIILLQGSSKALEAMYSSRVVAVDTLDIDCCTSSNIFNARPHPEYWCTCSHDSIVNEPELSSCRVSSW